MVSSRHYWSIGELLDDWRRNMALYWHCDWDRIRARSYFQQANTSWSFLRGRWGVMGDFDKHVMRQIETGVEYARNPKLRR